MLRLASSPFRIEIKILPETYDIEMAVIEAERLVGQGRQSTIVVQSSSNGEVWLDQRLVVS